MSIGGRNANEDDRGVSASRHEPIAATIAA